MTVVVEVVSKVENRLKVMLESTHALLSHAEWKSERFLRDSVTILGPFWAGPARLRLSIESSAEEGREGWPQALQLLE